MGRFRFRFRRRRGSGLTPGSELEPGKPRLLKSALPTYAGAYSSR